MKEGRVLVYIDDYMFFNIGGMILIKKYLPLADGKIHLLQFSSIHSDFEYIDERSFDGAIEEDASAVIISSKARKTEKGIITFAEMDII